MLLLAGSCQQEKLQTAGEEVLVTLDVQIPAEAQTKTISEAELTDIVYFEVWSDDWSKEFTVTPSSAEVVNCQAQVTLSLVKDQTYNFIFWAQNKDCGAYTTTDLKSVKVDYAKIAADGNQDMYDAFYAVKPFTITGPIKETVKLYRPFAQLNFGATKMVTSLGAITVGATEVTVSAGLATSFNTVEGKGEGLTTAPVTFKASGLVPSTETLDVDLNKNGSYEADEKFTWVSMDYMLMADESATYTIDAVFNVDGVGAVKHNLSYVPLKKNFRTNIVGDLFTSDANLTIIVDPDFNKPDEVIAVTYSVDSEAALAEVLTKVEDGDRIELATGTYTLPDVKDVQISIISDGTAVVKMTPDVAHNSTNYEGASLTFDNVVIEGEIYDGKHNGYVQAAREEYRNCTFKTHYMFAGDEVVVDNCTFVQNNGQYFWTGSSEKITFSNCVFNGVDRAVKIACVGNNMTEARVVIFNDCEFNATVKNKAALEIDNVASPYKVYVNDCTKSDIFNGWYNVQYKTTYSVEVYLDGAAI